MVCFDQVQLAEDGGDVEVVGKVLYVGQTRPGPFQEKTETAESDKLPNLRIAELSEDKGYPHIWSNECSVRDVDF